MASITIPPNSILERVLSIEIARVTERAAVAAARLRGRGAEKKSDQAAVDARADLHHRAQIARRTAAEVTRLERTERTGLELQRQHDSPHG